MHPKPLQSLMISESITLVKQAEADGFRSCWISEDYYFGGAMATAGAIAAVIILKTEPG